VEKVFPIRSAVEKVQDLLAERVILQPRNATSGEYTRVKFVL